MDPLTTVLLALILVSLSAICSGLNVALLAIHLPDIRRKAKLGDQQAKRVLPIRRRVHFYLSGILLANVAFASATSVVLGSALSGPLAVLLSTILLVVFAEITPQAFAVSRALSAVSHFAPAIKVATYVGYPLTKPLSILLDKLVGTSKAVLHTRNELSLLIADHLQPDSELDEDEVEIVQNAIQLSEKRVSDIMTPIEDTFYLLENEGIDEAKLAEIQRRSFSRIPILTTSKSRIKRYIMMKDMIDIDVSGRTVPLSELRTYKTKTVGSKTALDTMFRVFIAAKRHLIAIEKDNAVVGVVTIEDMIEEIIGHEIEDETDAQRTT